MPLLIIAPALLAWLDLFGIAVFAASGALAAARRQQTLVTFSFFACYRRGRRHGSRSVDRRACLLGP